MRIEASSAARREKERAEIEIRIMLRIIERISTNSTIPCPAIHIPSLVIVAI